MGYADQSDLKSFFLNQKYTVIDCTLFFCYYLMHGGSREVIYAVSIDSAVFRGYCQAPDLDTGIYNVIWENVGPFISHVSVSPLLHAVSQSKTDVFMFRLPVA